MKPTIRYIMLAGTALLFGFVGGGALQAQTDSEMARASRPTMAAPIRVVGAQIREVPSSFMRRPRRGEEVGPIEVLDLAVEVSSLYMGAFPPSLQPLLHIDSRSYPVQRVEYSNWDARHEKPIDKEAPAGETQTLHFFIENWQEVEQGQLMILSVLSTEEIRKATDGQFTVEQLSRAMPELTRKIPRYAPREFLELRQE